MSVRAYQPNADLAADPRDIEYQAFGIVIHKLTTAKTHAELAEAAHMNTRLWTALCADLGHPDNKLPNELKAQLISLGIWSIRQSSKVMGGEANVDSLVKVNRDIMQGLKKPGSSETQAA